MERVVQLVHVGSLILMLWFPLALGSLRRAFTLMSFALCSIPNGVSRTMIVIAFAVCSLTSIIILLIVRRVEDSEA